MNDEKYIRIISYAEEIGLITLIHAGYDVLSPDDIHCTPERAVDMLKKVGAKEDNKIILAHLGGFKGEEESFRILCGQNVWLDTSYVLDKIQPDFLIKMFEKHGFDKILFASDVPWGSQKKFVDTLKSLDISEENKEKIFHKNAEYLFALNL